MSDVETLAKPGEEVVVPPPVVADDVVVEETKDEIPESPVEESEEEDIELPEGWEKHKSVKDAVSAAYSQAQSNLDKAHRKSTRTQLAELESDLDSVHQQDLQKIHRGATASQVVTKLAESLRDADPADAVQLWGVIQQSEEWAEAFNGSRYVAGMNDILKVLTTDGLTAGLNEELLDDFVEERRKINLRLRREEVSLDQPKALQKNAALMQGAALELLTARDKIRDAAIVKVALDKERERLDSLAKKAAGVSARANEREKGAPPASVSGSGSAGRTDSEILADPKTPVSVLQEIRTRQRLAGG